MARALRTALLTALASLALAGQAQAGGGDYGFAGGTPRQQTTVRAALDASAFDWGIVPARVTIHIARGSGSYSTPGHVRLDAELLEAGRFAWAVVQDEYAHQVDFFLFDAAARERMRSALGAQAWCYEVAGLAHGAQGCERFASTLVWSYWPSRDNAYRPTSRHDESAAMAPAAFRSLLAELLGSRAAPQRSLSNRR